MAVNKLFNRYVITHANNRIETSDYFKVNKIK